MLTALLIALRAALVLLAGTGAALVVFAFFNPSLWLWVLVAWVWFTVAFWLRGMVQDKVMNLDEINDSLKEFEGALKKYEVGIQSLGKTIDLTMDFYKDFDLATSKFIQLYGSFPPSQSAMETYYKDPRYAGIMEDINRIQKEQGISNRTGPRVDELTFDEPKSLIYGEDLQFDVSKFKVQYYGSIHDPNSCSCAGCQYWKGYTPPAI